MYLGHLAAGLVLKARVREAPLSWLLLGTVLSDLLCGVLLLVGAEQIVVHGTLTFAHIQADIRYSHSLLFTLLLAVVVGVIAGRVYRAPRVGLAVGLAVLSHYVLDVLSHMPDMPVIGFGAQPDLILGTSLPIYPVAHFLIELGWCVFAWAALDRTDRRLLWTILLLMVSYANTLLGFISVPAQSSAVIGGSMLVLFTLTPALLLWAARTR